jgi:hypothetical protein
MVDPITSLLAASSILGAAGGTWVGSKVRHPDGIAAGAILGGYLAFVAAPVLVPASLVGGGAVLLYRHRSDLAALARLIVSQAANIRRIALGNPSFGRRLEALNAAYAERIERVRTLSLRDPEFAEELLELAEARYVEQLKQLLAEHDVV